MTEVRPLGSTGITPLPRYYGPLRLPTVNARWVIDSPPALSLRRNPRALGFTSGLPGSSADLSARALPNHPEQSCRFFRSLIPGKWQASPFPEGWPLSAMCNEAETGSLALGSRLRRRGRGTPLCSFFHRAGLTPHVRLPSRDRPRLHVERAIHMSDSFQSDRSARLGLAYRKTRKTAKTFRAFRVFRGLIMPLFSVNALIEELFANEIFKTSGRPVLIRLNYEVPIDKTKRNLIFSL